MAVSAPQSFYLWQPFEPLEEDVLEKAGPPRMLIRGIVSSELVDADGEVVLQDGIDWSFFKSKGVLTEEHPLGNTNIVGEPIDVSPTTVRGVKATQIDALLYAHNKRACKIWEQSVSMKKSGGTRQLGFSVEGPVLKRDPVKRRTITRSKVISSAISPVPKNLLTFWQPQIAAALQQVFGLDAEMIAASRAAVIDGLDTLDPAAELGPTLSPDSPNGEGPYRSSLIEGIPTAFLQAFRLLWKMPEAHRQRMIVAEAMQALAGIESFNAMPVNGGAP